MRICLVRHILHGKTCSSNFMLDLLNEIGTTTEVGFDPDADPEHLDAVCFMVSRTDYDVYVFFQSEDVAERVQSHLRGRIIIVPMYDAARQRPQVFWQQFVAATFVSFCRAQHESLIENSLRSRLFQYYPPVAVPSERPMDDQAAIFWERRPDQRLNVNVVVALCRRLGIRRLHVHGAPDFAGHDHRRYEALAAVHASVLAITHSAWFDARSQYEAVASVPLFFFAPREYEGIGIASLEALARGQIVVAPERPAVDEYVSHMTTGILYDLEDPESVEVPTPARRRAMSRAAATKAADGRADWLQDVERLKSIIADDGQRWSGGDLSSHFRNTLRTAASRRMFGDAPAARAPSLILSKTG